jgi:hypothetical protein
MNQPRRAGWKRRRSACLVLGTLALGCGGNQHLDQGPTNPAALRDTTGAVFAWNCSIPLTVPDASAPNTCDVALRADTPAVPDCGPGSAYFYLNDSTLARVCVSVPKGSGLQVIANLCRPVACSTTKDCPQFVESPFECRTGLCRVVGTTDAALGVVDAFDLCLASTRRPTSCTAADADATTQQAQHLVETSCGYDPSGTVALNDFLMSETPCPVPSTCRQP